MKKFNINLQTIGVVAIFAFVILIWFKIDASKKDREILELKKELVKTQKEQDSLSLATKQFIEVTNKTITNMDSLYKLSKKSKEDEIRNYWDSVYNSLVSNPDKQQMSDWLRRFATN